MALNLLIPRIEWKFIQIVGDRSDTSATLTNVVDTSEVEEGMRVTGTGFVAGTTVVSKTANTVTLSANASGSASAQTFDLNHRFDFRHPPSFDSEDRYKPENKISESISGVRQVQTNFIEATRDLQFGFLTRTERTTLEQTFFLSWAGLGNSFRYYYDQDDSPYLNYELEKYLFQVDRQVKKHPYFLYGLKLNFRRIES